MTYLYHKATIVTIQCSFETQDIQSQSLFYGCYMGMSMPTVFELCPRTLGLHFRQITHDSYYVTLPKANNLNANMSTSNWVLYICMPERSDYGYAASNVVATIVSMYAGVHLDISLC